MLHIHLADVERRGCIFERMGPVASAANTFMLPPTNEGSTAMVKKTMPRPPIHCMSDRQNRMPWGSRSTSSMMVAPVVVNPDMVSKKASVRLVMLPCMMKGNMPKTENTTQASVTTT